MEHKQPVFPPLIPYIPYVFMLKQMPLIPKRHCNFDKHASVISATLPTSVCPIIERFFKVIPVAELSGYILNSILDANYQLNGRYLARLRIL